MEFTLVAISLTLSCSDIQPNGIFQLVFVVSHEYIRTMKLETLI